MKTQSASLIPTVWRTDLALNNLMKTLKELEKQLISIPDFGVNHNKTTISNRYQIVEWLIFVSKNLNLKSETTFKAVHIFDLYLMKTDTVFNNVDELQFVAVVCLSLACKFEEVNCNYLNFMRTNLIERKCEKEEFISKELEILKTLKFNLNLPNFFDFNLIFIQIAVNKMSELKISANIVKKMLLVNDSICKNFVPMKECVFSSPLNSGLICFKTTLLSLSYLLGVTESDNSFETFKSVIDKELAVIFCEEYLKRCNIVSFNLFSAFVKNKKIN
jgi:hypothetical protein